MKIFLTGATGLLGSHICKQALLNGERVTALVGNMTERSYLYHQRNHHNLSIVQGNLHQFEINKSDFYDAIIHAAAQVSADTGQSNLFYETNVLGTISLHQKLKGHFRRWIQISSIATMCDGSKEIVSEADFGNCRPTPYARSKYEADLWLLKNEPTASFIYPTYLLGEWDSKPSSGAMILFVFRKIIKEYFNAYKNIANAEDVAKGIMQILNQQENGQFILGGFDIQLEEFFNILCQELEVKFTLKKIEFDQMESGFLKEFCISSKVSSQKAIQSFGYKPTHDLRSLLRLSINYFKQYGLLPNSKLLKTPFDDSENFENWNLILNILKNSHDLRPKIAIDKILPKSRFKEDLGFDSIAVISFLYELQAVFPHLDDYEVQKWIRLEDCLNSLEKYGFVE